MTAEPRDAVVLVHATAIAVGDRAALLRGPPGSGKSDLALRCLAQGRSPLLPEPAMLVSDDQVRLWRSDDGAVMLAAPDTIRGSLEVRGIGIIGVPHVQTARLSLVADLVAADAAIERLPEHESTSLLGVPIARFALHPFEASAPLKLLAALSRTGGAP